MYCKNARYLKDMFRNETITSAAGYLFDYNQTANPCGTAAKYFFNDTYMLIGPRNQSVFINETMISFEVDRNYKYFRHASYEFR